MIAPVWGWGSAGFFAAVSGSVLLGSAVVIRSRRHHAPVIELGLLASPVFSGAFAASLLYYAAFGAFVLNFVEFLTGVWHYSAIQAGLAIAPGPLMVLPFARVVAPFAARLVGPGRVAVLGCLVNATALTLWYTRMQVVPAYVTHLLPAQLLGGAGVGLAIPALLGAGSAALPPARFGTGSGILNMARQIGTVLGVSGLIAVLSHLVADGPIPAFRHGLLLIIGLYMAAGLVAASLLTRKPAGQSAAAIAVAPGQPRV